VRDQFGFQPLVETLLTISTYFHQFHPKMKLIAVQIAVNLHTHSGKLQQQTICFSDTSTGMIFSM